MVPLVAKHAVDLFPLLSDANLYSYTQEEPPGSIVALRERFHFLESRRSPDGSQAWLNWMVRELKTHEAIGYVQATVGAAGADIAWVVGTDYQRLGYATEASSAMVMWLRSSGANEVRAKIGPTHFASQRVAAKVGLSQTGEVAEGEEVWASIQE